MNAGGHDNEHMLSAPRGNRGKPMYPVHRRILDLRQCIKWATKRGNAETAEKLRLKIKTIHGGIAKMAQRLGSKDAAVAELIRVNPHLFGGSHG
jgi:hypothetical protein